MESNKTYNVTVENDSDILVTVSTVATVEISGAPVNVGTGAGISVGFIGDDLAFRTITTDANITATQNPFDVNLSLSDTITATSITSGNIVPLATNTYTLGTPTNVWADLYLGNASLYIDGTKVLGSDPTGDIDFTTDPGQSINIQSGNDVILIPTNAARIESQDVRLGLPAGTGTVTSYGTLNVIGDITRGGTTYRDRAIDFTGGNATITTDAATYLHLDTPLTYVGSFADYTQIQGSTITASLVGDVTGTVSSLSNHTTDNLAEGSNQYYTDAKVDARIPTVVSAFTNDSLYSTTNEVATAKSEAIAAAAIDATTKADAAEAAAIAAAAIDASTKASTVETLAIAAAEAKDVTRAAAAALDATTKADAAEAAAIAAAEAKDVIRAAAASLDATTKADAAEAAAIAAAEAKDVTRALAASQDASTKANAAQAAAIAEAEAKDVIRAAAASLDATTKADAAEAAAIAAAALDATTKADAAEAAAIVASGLYTDAEIAALVDSSPATLDTLNELAAALGDDPNFATTVSTQLGQKLNTADFTTNFNTRFANKTTDDLTEGSNQYHTTDRVRSSISMISTNVNELSYDPITGVISYVSPTTVTASNAVTVEVRNQSGVTIEKGDAVYISGHSGTRVLVSLAESDVPAHVPALGLASGTMVNNSDGLVTVYGELAGIDTSAFIEGDALYIDVTPGQLTNIRPTSANVEVQKIGKVARANINGLIIISGSGRTNDVPNLDSLEVFIGNGGGYNKRQLTISDMSDVDTTTVTPTAGQALVWDNINLQWEPGDTAGVEELQQLTNVTITGVTSGQALVYNGTAWVNSTPNTTVQSINAIGDVSIYGTPTDGESLIWDNANSEWTQGAATLPPFQLSTATDVSSTAPPPSAGDVLTWNAFPLNQWIPAALPTIPTQLDDLGNVSSTAPNQSDVLTWDQSNSEWRPLAASAGATNIFDLQDVTTGPPGSLVNGAVLQWNANTNEFLPTTLQTGATSLNGLSDVQINQTPNFGEALVWNGSYFIPQTVGGGGGPLDSATDVHYYNISNGATSPAFDDILIWQYNPNIGAESWVLRPSFEIGPSSLDQIPEVQYIDIGSLQPRSPTSGDKLTWGYNNNNQQFGWLLDNLGGGGGPLDSATDVSYTDALSGQNRAPFPGDSLQWNYNNQIGQYQWLLSSGGGGGGGPLDQAASDVSYVDVFSGQYRAPQQGDFLQWNYNSQSNNFEWLLIPSYAVGGGPLDIIGYDVEYIDIGSLQPRSPQPGDKLTWGFNFNTNQSGWYLESGSGGGAAPLNQVASDIYYPYGIPNYGDTLQWDGGNWVAQFPGFYSDATLKTDITTLAGSLDRVCQLRGVSYNWVDPNRPNATVGVIAQEVEKVLPEVVHTNQDGLKMVEYGNMVGVLIEAIKEQQDQIEALKARITTLEG